MKGYLSQLRYKLLLYFLIVTGVLLVIYSVIWVAITKEQIINASSSQVTATTKQANTLVDDFFTQRINHIKAVSDQKKEITRVDLEQVLAFDPSINQLMLLSPSAEEQFVVTRKGKQQEKLANPSQLPEFKLAIFMSGQTYISPAFNSNNDTSVRIAVPAGSSGVLIADISLDGLTEKVQGLIIGKTGSIYIVDKKGAVVYHPDKNAFPLGKDVTSVPVVKQFTQKFEQSTSNQSNNEKGEEALTYQQTNVLTGWGIVTQVPLAEITQPISGIIWYAVLLFIGALIFAALLSLALDYGVVSSLQKLKTGFENFYKGNLAFRVPVSGNDDVAELARYFNKMIGEVHEAFLKADKQRAELTAEKADMEKSFAAEKDRMQHVLSDDREKVNYGLFVEKEKANAIMANMTDAVILLNKNREIMFLNKQAEDLLGYASHDMEHKLITAAMKVYDKDTEITWDEYAPMNNMNAVQGNVITKERVRVENATITPRFVKLLTVKTNFNQTDELGFILILHNLDQEMQLEKTQMNFVGSVAHELKLPLSVITQCFPMLRQPNTPETQAIYLNGVQIGVDQLGLMMQNFILAQQLEEKTVAQNVQNTDVVAVIRQTMGMVAPLAQLRLTQLNFEEPKDPLAMVSADQTHVRDAMLNLLTNAIKFTQKQGTITITARQLGDNVLVEVQDTGPGITKEYAVNLFKKFYTVPDTKEQDAVGTGLGLYIVKSLIELNKGKVWADSIEGKGSTFGFSLPKAATN